MPLRRSPREKAQHWDFGGLRLEDVEKTCKSSKVIHTQAGSFATCSLEIVKAQGKSRTRQPQFHLKLVYRLPT